MVGVRYSIDFYGFRRVFLRVKWQPVEPSWKGWEMMRVSKRKFLQLFLMGCGPNFWLRCLRQPWNPLVANLMWSSLFLGFWNSKGWTRPPRATRKPQNLHELDLTMTTPVESCMLILTPENGSSAAISIFSSSRPTIHSVVPLLLQV